MGSNPYLAPQKLDIDDSDKSPAVKTVILWITMPLATVVGSIAGSSVLFSLMWFEAKVRGGFSEDGWYYLYIMPGIISCAQGALWPIIAHAVAPSSKFITSTIMTTIYVVMSLIFLALIWTIQDCDHKVIIQLTINIILTCISSIVSAANQKNIFRTS